jgi:hypothetical protein
MEQPTDSRAEVERRLGEVTARIGELVVEHERLTAQREAQDRADPPGGDRDAGSEAVEPMAGSDDARLKASDRVAYVRAMRESMFRLLHAVDFTLVSGRIDGPTLRGARAQLVESIDRADACLMLDDAHELVILPDDG